MKKLIVLLVALMATTVLAQEKSIVTVRSSEVSGGVVILNVRQMDPVRTGHTTFELHCNKGMADCTAPPAGNYLMVRLPKNWGTYDCNNVDLYPTSAEPTGSEKIGEYCLIEK